MRSVMANPFLLLYIHAILTDRDDAPHASIVNIYHYFGATREQKRRLLAPCRPSLDRAWRRARHWRRIRRYEMALPIQVILLSPQPTTRSSSMGTASSAASCAARCWTRGPATMRRWP